VAYSNPTAAFTTAADEIDYYSGFIQFINNSVNAQYYNWEFGYPIGSSSTETNPNHYYPGSTEANYLITLVATDINGCSDQTSLLVSSKAFIRLNVPNTVTIDDNGLNEIFFPIFSDIDKIIDYNFEIFNRWGELVFVTKDILGAWDGNYQGEKCQDGTYIWKITYKDIEGLDHQVVGHINILR
jgi:gliding motility-associated-like protein